MEALEQKDLDRKAKSEERTKLIQEVMSRAKFEEFFAKHKEQMIKAGDVSWTDELSPYEGMTVQGGVRDEDEEVSDW